MAAGVNGTITINADISFGGATIAGAPRTEHPNITKLVQFAPGNGALGLADVLYHGYRNLAGSANEDLDMKGVLTDPFGALVQNAEICAIIVRNDAASPNNLIMKPGATNSFLGPLGAAAHTLAIEPGEVLPLCSTRGWPVTDATGDKLNFANAAAGAINYEILIIGRTVVG